MFLFYIQLTNFKDVRTQISVGHKIFCHFSRWHALHRFCFVMTQGRVQVRILSY